MATSAELMEKFQNKYAIDISFEQMEKTSQEIAQKFKYLDNFLIEKDTKISDAQKYMNGLLTMFNRSIENRLKASVSGKAYNLSDLDAVQFIRDYEEIMQARHAENGVGERKKHDGIKASKLLKNIVESTKKYDKPLSEIWADSIVNDSMKLEDMKEITQDANNDLSWRKTSLLVAEQKRTFSNIVIAQQAMTKVCSERGFFWKVFHLVRWFQEKNYLKTLTADINEYRNKKFPVDEILNKYAGSMMKNTYDGIEKFKAEQKQATNQKEEVAKANENVEVKEKVAIPEANAMEKAEVSAPVQNAPNMDVPNINKN